MLGRLSTEQNSNVNLLIPHSLTSHQTANPTRNIPRKSAQETPINPLRRFIHTRKMKGSFTILHGEYSNFIRQLNQGGTKKYDRAFPLPAITYR
jgi:hypothetical protein